MKALTSALALLAFAAFAPSADATTVATINGCYDCLAFDTPGLQINNTTGGNLTNAQMVLNGYQALNNGLTATLHLGTISSQV